MTRRQTCQGGIGHAGLSPTWSAQTGARAFDAHPVAVDNRAAPAGVHAASGGSHCAHLWRRAAGRSLLDRSDIIRPRAGPRFLRRGESVPSQWTTFFGAEDVDKTLQVITDKGGAVLRPADDTPYGRLAAAADPTGVMFNLSSLHN